MGSTDGDKVNSQIESIQKRGFNHTSHFHARREVKNHRSSQRTKSYMQDIGQNAAFLHLQLNQQIDQPSIENKHFPCVIVERWPVLIPVLD
jgi:hypothetical protein